MAITLIATAGASDANTYTSLADAELYFETRLHSETWDDAVSEDKKAALLSATTFIDIAYDWAGYKATSEQSLRWPRTGVYDVDGFSVASTEIPSFLSDAISEMSFAILSDDRLLENATSGFSQLKVGSIYMQMLSSTRAGIIPTTVDFLLSGYATRGATGQQSGRRLERC